jgi:hypothetical protein
MPPEDYEAIEAAVLETARGRWFLAEFARRNRSADTSVLLAAIERLESMLQTQGAPTTPHQPISEDLPATSAKSELFAVDHGLRGLLTSVPDDVAWATTETVEEISDAAPDVVEIDDQAPIWPTQAPAAPAPPPAVEAPSIQTPPPAQSAMLAAALAHAEKMAAPESEPEETSGGIAPAAADPAELDALSFEEKSVYFA